MNRIFAYVTEIVIGLITYSLEKNDTRTLLLGKFQPL